MLVIQGTKVQLGTNKCLLVAVLGPRPEYFPCLHSPCVEGPTGTSFSLGRSTVGCGGEGDAGSPVPVPGDRLLPKCRDDSAPAADTKKLSQQLPLAEVGRQLAGTNVFQKDHDRRRRCSRECKEPGMDGKIRSPDDWVWL